MRASRDLTSGRPANSDRPGPADAAPATYNWGDILRRKEQLSAELVGADWVIHCDPDEVRESPWGPAVSLRQAVFVAHTLGYSLINFNNLVVFRPVGELWLPREANLSLHITVLSDLTSVDVMTVKPFYR